VQIKDLSNYGILAVHPQPNGALNSPSSNHKTKAENPDELIYPLASSLNAPVLRCANLLPHRQFLTHAVALNCWELNDAIKGRMCNSVIPIMRTVINAARAMRWSLSALLCGGGGAMRWAWR
jgi:hypothetical protein